MESLVDLVHKLEAPLVFAADDGCKRVPLIKNLGGTMVSLLQRFSDRLGNRPDPPDRGMEGVIARLRRLFDDYDRLSPQQKPSRLAEAASLVAALKALVVPCDEMSAAGQACRTGSATEEAPLSMPLDALRGVGPRTAALLAAKGLSTIEDLLFYLPRRYEDRRTVCRIDETAPGVNQTVAGKITLAEMRFYGRRRVFEVTVQDGHGILKAKWFKGREAFLRGVFQTGKRVILTGQVGGFPFGREMIHPDFDILDDDQDQLLHFKRIVPVYSETEGLPQKTLRRILWQAVRDYAPLLKNPIPDVLCRKHRLQEIGQAVRQVHFPEADQEPERYQEARSGAHRTLIYRELFLFQLAMALRKRGAVSGKKIVFQAEGAMLTRFYGALPFALTQAQERVIGEIARDMTSLRSMNRLLQGDVGSGKTVVSMAAVIIACQSGYQSALMAPTEILAEQHYRTLRGWGDIVGLKIALVTGGLKTAEKRDLRDRLIRGEIDVAIGTHALIQEKVLFKNLGLVVIDEQHRFGVIQRAALRQKGSGPEVLVMTATPIPRSLAMTVYGDLDVSVLDERPPGKQPIQTKVFHETQRGRVYELIRRQVSKGNQVFIVYPLVEESENLDMKDAKHMAAHLQKEVFPGYRIGLVHGRMKADEKERVMADFTEKRMQILVSTTVIEVGIDIPDASLMVIEHAERFGLSQLHQLRGRVGRSDIPSFCVLMAHRSGSDSARRRLRIMEETSDGFRIAEADLALRGPGEFMGTRQAGLPDFRVAHIVRDGPILSDARADAIALVDEDPRLERREHLRLREALFEGGKRGLPLGTTA